MEELKTEFQVAKAMGISRRRLALYRQNKMIIGIKVGRSWSYTESAYLNFVLEFQGKNISTPERMIYERNKLHPELALRMKNDEEDF